MNPLTANLKTLYQHRTILFSHFWTILGISIIMMIIYKIIPIDFITLPLAFIFCYGLGIGDIGTDILSKPFGFCLPGQINTAQKMFLLIWLSIIIIIPILMAALSFMGIKSEYVYFLVSLGLLSLSYWLGVAIIHPIARFVAILFSTILAFITVVPACKGIKLIEPLFWSHPYAITFSICILGMLSCFLYTVVGRRYNPRRLFSSRIEYGYTLLNQDQRHGRVPEWVGNYFSTRVKSNHNSMFLSHLLGQIHLIIGPLYIYRKWILISCPIIFVFFAVIPIVRDPGLYILHLSKFIFASLFCSIAFSVDSAFFNYQRLNLFLLIDRKEHFWRGIVVLFTVVLIALGFMATFILLFNLLSEYLPPIILGRRSSILPFEWALLVVPIIMIPLLGGMVILFRKTILMICMIIIFYAVVAVSSYAVKVMENMAFIIDSLIVISAAVITWGFHLAALYYDSMKRSLS